MKTNAWLIPSFTAWLAALMLFMAQGALAQVPRDPPARVGTLSHMEGSVAFAPSGETEWFDAVRNRPVTAGDRLWTDEGSRAELQLGSATLHMDGRTFLEIEALDAQIMRATLNEGSAIVRVRRLDVGEDFEIDTPQLAFRAAQPGDFRIDVDARRGFTQVSVRSGATMLYGAGGDTMQLVAGQQMAFLGRDLAPARGVAAPGQDAFDTWAAERNRAEDASDAARHVPRDVVGYQELDTYGTWLQDPDYGAVWYPQVAVADWAPYRYGRWEWINPWGWTWVDDAPWGFAPFHYGRWAMVGNRWGWVPGPLGPHPVYAPALVTFVGDSANGGIGWYPLAPGEAWQPFFAASPLYVSRVNRYVAASRWNDGRRDFHRRPDAITSMGLEDFSRGRGVREHWVRMSPADIGRTQAMAPPRVLDSRRWWAERSRGAPATTQRAVQQAMPSGNTPQLLPQERRTRDDRQAPVHTEQDRTWRQQGLRVWPQERPPRQPAPAPQQLQQQQLLQQGEQQRQLQQRREAQRQVQQHQQQLLQQQILQQQAQREAAMRQQQAGQDTRQQTWRSHQGGEVQRGMVPEGRVAMPQGGPMPQPGWRPQDHAQGHAPAHGERAERAQGQRPWNANDGDHGSGRGRRFN